MSNFNRFVKTYDLLSLFDIEIRFKDIITKFELWIIQKIFLKK